MRIFITGGTGLIGSHLARELLARGDQVVVLTRSAEKARRQTLLAGAKVVEGDPSQADDWHGEVDGCDAVVHLAGKNLFSERWNDRIKKEIRESRVKSTAQVVEAMRRCSKRPRVFVCGSAIGYYGPHGDEELTESSPPGDDFMARVCVEWEEAAGPAASELGMRLAIVRTGIVLDREEGALGVMTPLFKLGPGVPVGSSESLLPALGRQWMSWIHRDDIVGLFRLAIDDSRVSGPINGTAPYPVRNAEFSRALSSELWKPTAFWRVYLPVGPPDWLLKLTLGEVADVVVKGQRVLPGKALDLRYEFKHPRLTEALAAVFESSRQQAS